MSDEIKNNEIKENQVAETPAADGAAALQKKNIFQRFGNAFVNFFKNGFASMKQNHKNKKEQRKENWAAFKKQTGKQKAKTILEWFLLYSFITRISCRSIRL